NQQLGRDIVTEGIEQQALAAMCEYQWPGNVRELANAIEGAMTFGRSALIGLADLPSSLSPLGSLTSISNSSSPSAVISNRRPISALGTFADVERDLILRALKACDWNK